MFAPFASDRPLTLDELGALNDEILALLRAGIPLELGLRAMSTDLPSRLRKAAEDLAQRLERGESLSAATSTAEGGWPAHYSALVQAGIRSGRLTAALEGLAQSAARMAELRRMTALALLYPFIIVMLEYLLAVGFSIYLAPTFAEFFEALDVPSGFMRAVATVGRSLSPWAWYVPIVAVLAFVVWWWFTARASILAPRGAWRLLGWVPLSGRLYRHAISAAFADVLSVLVAHGVPLDEAVVLAADSTGDRRLEARARTFAGQLRAGLPLATAMDAATPLPPLLVWMMQAGQQRGQLAGALADGASLYQDKALEAVAQVRLALPILLTGVFAGGATMAYALLMYLPWTHALLRLSQ